MELLSPHEALVWWEFQHAKSTSDIASEYERSGSDIASEYERSGSVPEHILNLLQETDSDVVFKDAGYVSRVLNRARKKIANALTKHATSHRLDIESLLDYKGLLIGFDYQANAQVYIVFTMKLGVIVWYAHDSYAGELCPECPKVEECRETLDTIKKEYDIKLRPDEKQLHMTKQSIAIFNKLAAKEVPRYKRKEK